MTQQTETTRYRFDAKIIGKEERSQKVIVKLDWKLPGSQFELMLYLEPIDAESLKVGDRLNWSITRGGLGKSKDGSLKTGQYPSDYFWNWDKDDSHESALYGTRDSPTVFEDNDAYPQGNPDEAERSMNSDFAPTQTRPGFEDFGNPRDMEPERTEKPNAPPIEQDKYQLSAARRDAMILIEMGVWEIPEGRNPLSWVKECSARMFYFHHSTVMEPQYWCYEHNKGRNPGSNGYGHPVADGSCVWEKGIIIDEGE